MSAWVYPSDYRAMGREGLARREVDVLERLAEGLPDQYRIYHGIHWSRLEAGLSVTGRIQFLVLTPSGLLILLVMKTGLMRQDAQGNLYKQLGEHRQDIFNELCEQRDLLQARFQSQHGKSLLVEFCLYCPDHQVDRSVGLAGLVERVIDAENKDQIVSFLIGLESLTQSQASLVSSQADAESVHRFLTNQLEMVPELGAWSNATEQWVTRLTQGLEHWVGRLSFEPFRLRVQGTAGCGKSQLAMRELGNAHLAKSRALYVCYNRPLAARVSQQIREEALRGAQAFNFHALCDRVLKDAGQSPDYSRAQAFEKLVTDVLSLPPDKRWVFDTIVIDEGQDFDAQWLAVLQRFAHAHTRWIWLEDPAQNLYAKPSVELKGWVNLHLNMNYRNPQRIVEFLVKARSLFQIDDPRPYEIEAACPLEGMPVGVHIFHDEVSLRLETGKAVTECLKAGFSREEVVVLSMRGFEHSRVLQLSELGPHSLAHFTGQYDSQGNQTFTEGSVLAESVYRFKGQSANALVITELQFEDWNEKDYRKLFVALTRAKYFVTVVASKATAAKLGLLK